MCNTRDMSGVTSSGSFAIADDSVCAASRSPGALKGVNVSSLGGAGGLGWAWWGTAGCQSGSSSCLKSIELDQSNEFSSVSMFEISSGISDMSNKLPSSERVSPIPCLSAEALLGCSRSLEARTTGWLQGQVTVWKDSGALAPGWRSLNVHDLVDSPVACSLSRGAEEVRSLGGGSGSSGSGSLSDMLDANGLARSAVFSS